MRIDLGMKSIMIFLLLALFCPNTVTAKFGNNGKVTTDFGNGNSDCANSLVLQPDGKLVAAGYSWNGKCTDFALARYMHNGGLDRVILKSCGLNS
jgi:hypothetical protein